MYYQQLAGLGDRRWGVVSMSMRSPEARDQVRSVNLRYPVLELGEEGERLTWVEALREALDLQQDFSRVKEVLCLPELEIISLTITEKGYCISEQGLELEHRSIRHDLTHPERPESAIGLLALGIKLRHSLGLPGVTILSCDNLRENGQKLELALTQFLGAQKQTNLIEWMKRECRFPNTMVDRIVPSLTEEKIHDLEGRHELRSSQLIATEKFTQWVVEDKFRHARPPLERVGVEFVPDVRPFEEMKLRLLNASHSFLAYAGLNRGHRFVHEAIRDEELLAAVRRLMLEEVVPVLAVPPGFDVRDYVERLLLRFRNTHLPHQLKQIAMDGSQKLPQRIFPSLLQAPATEECALVRAVAEWLKYCWGKLASAPAELDDPWREEFLSLVPGGKEAWVKAMLRQRPLAQLATRPELLSLIERLALK
jgi:fructuronate reductase